MKAVMSSLLPDIQAMRKRTGADRWDEMWEGVLHMPPMPNRVCPRAWPVVPIGTDWGDDAPAGEVSG